jgi:hypothetical protein
MSCSDTRLLSAGSLYRRSTVLMCVHAPEVERSENWAMCGLGSGGRMEKIA